MGRDVWGIRGIDADLRERILEDARARGVPVGRVVQLALERYLKETPVPTSRRLSELEKRMETVERYLAVGGKRR